MDKEKPIGESNQNTQVEPLEQKINVRTVANIVADLQMTQYCDPYDGGDIGKWLDQFTLNSDPLRVVQEDPSLIHELITALRTEANQKDLRLHSRMDDWNDVITIVFQHSNHPEVKGYTESDLWDVTVEVLFRIRNEDALSE